MERSELEQLLFRHRLTFNWADPGLKWWLLGQLKGSNKLIRSEPQHADNKEAAQIAATQFIKNIYK
jgi:hypothetical protein